MDSQEYLLKRDHGAPYVVSLHTGGVEELCPQTFSHDKDRAQKFDLLQALTVFYRSVRRSYPKVGTVDNVGLRIVEIVDEERDL